MKILLISSVCTQFDENTINIGGLGGAETWVIQIANEFAFKGHNVFVVCNCATHKTNNGINYIAQSQLTEILSQEKFDLCILNRSYYDLFPEINKYKSCDNVFIQAHDVLIYGEDINTLSQYPCFKGVSTLSAYQERCLHNMCGVDWKYMIRIGNGVDHRIFEQLDCTPTSKRLLFSSDYQRGGDIIKDYLLNKIPEIGVDYCSYFIPNIEQNDKVSIIGSLGKHDLYKEMSKRYCWFYPSVFNETFCITILENIMAENDLILPLDWGMSSVLEPFINDVSMKHRFNDSWDEFYLAVDEATVRINDSITNHEKGEELRKELKNYVLCNYTWDRIAEKWLKLV